MIQGLSDIAGDGERLRPENRLWRRSRSRAEVQVRNLTTLLGRSDTVASIAPFNVGRRLVNGSEDGTVKVWDLSSQTALMTLEHTGPVRADIAL